MNQDQNKMDDWQDLYRPMRRRLDADWLTSRIQLVFSAFRKDDFHDPEGFILTLGMNLERFPKEVVEYVTDPVTGIQTKTKWPPSVLEVLEACRAEMEHRALLLRHRAMPAAEVRLPRPTIPSDESYEKLVIEGKRKVYGPFDDGREVPYKG